jgi:L-alanine-DL-glutamate epimerase-like enolase superfamily enzyme
MEDDLIIEPFAVKNGHIEVPEKPGIGVEIDEDAVDNYRVVT